MDEEQGGNGIMLWIGIVSKFDSASNYSIIVWAGITYSRLVVGAEYIAIVDDFATMVSWIRGHHPLFHDI